jgi:outer membrane protein assembly factor BamD (BamD/ComL family)
MKKGLICLFFVVSIFSMYSGCSRKAGEKEYFDLAYQYMGKEEWSEAEKYFQKILDEYPNGVYSSKSLFMVGFINANYLKNYDKAKKYYTEFLKKYPNHDLADDAKYEIENLGKNIDDLPFMKEEKSQSDSVTADAPKSTSASVY